MLHKQPSNKHNQWKYALLLPLLATFMFAFNTKTIAQKKKIEVKKQDKHKIELIINKNTSDATLNSEKEIFKKEFDVTLKFKGIKRNSKGEITAIKIDVTSPKSNANFSVSRSTPIKPIQISFNNEYDSISIRNIEAKQETIIYNAKNKDDAIWTKRKNKIDTVHTAEIIFRKKNKGKNVWIHSDDKKHKKAEDIENNDGDENPLYIIDGKEASKKEFENIEPNTIKKKEVLKGEKAVEKYGKKAKNGVIVITSKN